MDRCFWVASLVWLLGQQWMTTAVKGEECDYVFISLPLATDSCVVMVNSTGMFSSKASCTDNEDLNITYWNTGNCTGQKTRTDAFSLDDNANFTWVCDAENSGEDCSRTLYRVYSEEGCSSNSNYYSEFYIVNDICVPWTHSQDGESVMYTCEDKGNNDVMRAHVYFSDNCTGAELAVANFTSGCTEDNHRITITCEGSSGGNGESSAMTAFGSIFAILIVSLVTVFIQ